MQRPFGVLIGSWVLVVLALAMPVRAQVQCATPLSFTPVSQPNQIEWSKFPTFSLPFSIIYNGPRFTDTQASPLQHGFSHLVEVKDSEFGTLVKTTQRATVYYGFATGLNQPWETLESPWANDLTAYRAKWDNYLMSLSGGQKNAAGLYVLPVGRLSIDIERFLASDTQILKLKQNTQIPATYRSLSDTDFLLTYKNAMRNLYAEGARYIRQHVDLSNVNLSSYADTPILNTYLNVPTFTWTDWTTNLSRTNYIVQDSTGKQIGGPYYSQLDALGPTGYYLYDYPSPLAPDYLSYLLFQVEANRAWSTRPIVPWVWMRYHNESSSYPNFIQPFMAEATAIFPFFSGAAGLWLWDDPTLAPSRTDVYAAYEYFVQGLYRLSQVADMFKGTYELVIETNARDLMDKQLPVWRGVVNGTKIAIAAQNPYAAEGATTSLNVQYKNWQQTITLTGRSVYLCTFDMGAVTAIEPVLPLVTVSPNPAQTVLTVTFAKQPPAATTLQLLNTLGQIVVSQTATRQTEPVSVQTLPAGVYVLRIQHENQLQTLKVVIRQ